VICPGALKYQGGIFSANAEGGDGKWPEAIVSIRVCRPMRRAWVPGIPDGAQRRLMSDNPASGYRAESALGQSQGEKSHAAS